MNPLRKTKIICTYGPAVASREKIIQLINAGMNVVRFNFSHGDHDYHRQGINLIKEIRDELSIPLAILVDTKGPEIRTGVEQESEFISFSRDDQVTLTTEKCINTDERIYIDYPDFVRDLDDNSAIYLDDGHIMLKVLSKTKVDAQCIVIRGGEIKAKRGVNVPGVLINLPFLTDKDKADLEFAAEMDVDIVALSFVRSVTDIRSCRQFLFQHNGFSCDIVAKIENPFAVENIQEIGFASDGIMIARGDLGVELPVEEVPKIQKDIIKTCMRLGKPVITATQMLESMTLHSRPTRAEISDVANAIYDSTSAIMLSGETANGNYPVECVEIMASVALNTEADIHNKVQKVEYDMNRGQTNALANAAIATAQSLEAKAIIPLTRSGHSARLVSRLRPNPIIIGATSSERTFHKMSLYWGVIPILLRREGQNLEDLFEMAHGHVEDCDILGKGDIVVMMGGSPIGASGATNLIRVDSIGHVVTRGKTLNSVDLDEGLVHLYKNKNSVPEGRVLVMKYLLDEDLPALKKAKGLIIQTEQGEDKARIIAQALQIPMISRAEGVCTVLNEREAIRIDGHHGIIYRVKEKDA
ncbi:MAG: pyruvate kinase [Planctomycetes bacterium]|nr:pyruvate kinase [Planctomycetota bacterium]